MNLRRDFKRLVFVASLIPALIHILIIPAVANNQAILDKFSADPNKIGTIVIEGYAYDESKLPVEGALVDVYNTYRNSTAFLARNVELIGSGHTDSEGKFQFVIKQPEPNIDSQFAIIYRDGYALKIAQHQSNLSEFDQVILTKKHTHYSGHVTDTGGNPIAGATVYAFVEDLGWTVRDLTYETALSRWLQAKTDNKGNFEFTNIPTNAKGEFGVIAEGYANSYTWPTEKLLKVSIPAGRDNIEIVMQKPSELFGTLVDESTSQPIPNERVYLFRLSPSRDFPFMNFNSGTKELAIPYSLENDTWELMTDDAGNFTADNLTPGDYGLSVYSYISPERTWSSMKQIVSVPEGSSIKATLKAVKTGRVKIQVTNRDDMAPMENVSIKVIPKKLNDTFIQNLVEFSTDSTGTIELSLSPGEYILDSLIKKGYVCLDTEVRSFIIESDQTSEIQTQMAYSPGFWGICLDRSGSPVSGADIYIKETPTPIATSDSDGLFSISPETIKQTKDILVISARQKSLNLGGILFQDVHWTDKLLQIEMKPTIKLSGKLADNDGNPIANTNLEIILSDTKNLPYSMKNSVLISQPSDESGNFYIDVIPSEYPYALQVAKDGYEKFYFPLENHLVSQEDSDLGELVLRRSSLTISGYLADQLGYPIEGIEISIFKDEEYGVKPVISDPNGRFKIDNLAEGNIKLKAKYKWDLYEYGLFQAGTDGNRFVLENNYENGRWFYPRDKKPLDGAKVQVTLLDAETGEPISGKGAYLQILGDNISNPFLDPDGTGKVIFSVDAGHYKLESEKHPDYLKTNIEVDVESGQEYQFQLSLNRMPKLTGKITDFQGNPVENVECKIYPMEYYGFGDITISADSTYELVWDASKYQQGREPYLFVESADLKCGRFYRIEISQQQLDIVLEPAAYLIFEDQEKLMVGIRFYDKNWENYSFLNTNLKTKKAKESGLLKISGLYPIPEELEYHVSVSENGQEKEALISSDQITAGQEIRFIPKDISK